MMDGCMNNGAWGVPDDWRQVMRKTRRKESKLKSELQKQTDSQAEFTRMESGNMLELLY